MQFSNFSQFLAELELITKRLEITAILAKLYAELEGEEIRQASYLLLGSLRPAYDSLEFQMSSKMVLRALAAVRAAERPPANQTTDLFGSVDTTTHLQWVTERYVATGDIGQVACELLSQIPSSKTELTIAEVFTALNAIATLSGVGSQELKVVQLQGLLERLDAISAKYVCRIVIGKMRLGFNVMTLLDALSWTIFGDKRDHDALEAAFQKRADIGQLAFVYLSAKATHTRDQALADYSVVAGVPIVPQLCQRLGSPTEVVEKMGTVFAEPKYDGLRAQLHVRTINGKREVHVFTRSLENVTAMFPEAASAAGQLQVDSVVLDAEAIGFNPESGELLQFQETITRKRKHEITETALTVPIRFYVFDLLFLNGTPYIDRPLRERKELLNKTIQDTEYIVKTNYIESSKPEEIQHFHESQLGSGLEGVVIKQPESPYQGGRKGWHWVKLKELAGTRGKLADTLDCVVMGYYPGKGKRTQFGIGAFLVGVRSGDSIVTIAKIGTGLSDDQFRELKTLCTPLETTQVPAEYRIPKELVPQRYVVPELVVEIAADEVTVSPTHSAGVALRFPRLITFRPDKKLADASELAEVKQLMILANSQPV